MTIHTIVPLIIGLVFIGIGFFAARFYGWKKLKTFAPVLIGLFLIYISTIGPLSETNDRIHQIIEIDEHKVESIVLQPTRALSYEELNMLTRDTILSDRELLKEMCMALHKAKMTGEGFLKNPQSVCRIQINMADKTTIVFGVRKAAKTTCIAVDSNGETGWHFGNLDASDLGLLLDKILRIEIGQKTT